MTTLRIRELPLATRPLARLQQLGPAALSDAELLALLIQADRLDDAQRLLVDFGGWSGLLRASLAELQRIPGIGPMRAAQLKSALEIGRRLLTIPEQRPQIKSPADAAQLLLLEMGHLDQEELRVLCLDTKNRLQRMQTVYVGSVNASQVRVAEVFKEAVRRNSPAILVCHNHPSGQAEPSPEDVQVTRAIVAAGKLLDIETVDHLIIGHGVYVSLRERRLGFDGS